MKPYTKSHSEGRATDLIIHYCPECNTCWEKARAWKWVGRTRRYINGYYFYKDFPTYGKKRVTCCKCEGKKLRQTLFLDMLLWEVVDDNKLQKTKGE